MDIPKRQSIEFHIRSDDYFATLATVLDLIFQQSERIIEELTGVNEQLKVLKDDLMFLQKNYKIIKRKRCEGKSE